MTQVLRALGLPIIEWSVQPSHGLTLVALLSIWLHLPFTFVILYSARLAIPGELYEAADRRRRDHLAAVPADHVAAADAGDPDRDAVPLHLRIPPVLGSLAADAGRAGAHDRGARRLPLSRSVPLQRLRRCGCDRLAAGAGVAGARRSGICAVSTRRCLRPMRSTGILGSIGKAIGLALFAAWSLVPIVDDRDVVVQGGPRHLRGAAALAVHADARQLRDAGPALGRFLPRAVQQPDRHRRRDRARHRRLARSPATPIRATAAVRWPSARSSSSSSA